MYDWLHNYEDKIQALNDLKENKLLRIIQKYEIGLR